MIETPNVPASRLKGRDVLRAARTPAGWSLLAVAAVAILTLIYGERHALVSPQGSQCLRAAWNLAATGALDVAPGRPFAWFGPLYPVLLAGLARAGFPPLLAVAFVNSAALVATIALFAALARRAAPGLAAPATIFFAALASNAYLFRMVRPDILMVPAALLVVLSLARYAEGGRRADLLWAAAGCALASAARYMALFALLPLVVVGVRLAWRHARVADTAAGLAARGPRARVIEPLLFLALAWGPAALWLLRNRVRTGYLTGMSRTAWREQAASTDLGTNLLGTAKTFLLDLFGVRVMGVVSQVYGEAAMPYPRATWALAGIAVLLAALATLLRSRARTARPRAGAAPNTVDPPGAGRARGADAARSAHVARLVALAAASYLAALLTLWTWGNNDPIHTRYVAPLYAFLTLMAFRFAENSGRPARLALAAAALAIVAPNVDKTVRLLGESPGDALIRVSLHGHEDLWMQGIGWADAVRPIRRGATEP